MNSEPTPTVISRRGFYGISAAAIAAASGTAIAEDKKQADAAPQAFIDGSAPGWTDLTEKSFVAVNCFPDTWSWTGNSVKCTGNPVGVIRSAKPYTNFELVCEWRHMKDAGNSGVFIWSPIETLDRLDKPGLPEGIECQVLDLGYTEMYEKGGNKATWFTCHGDVFPVGKSTMKPFGRTSPNGRRSFPSEDRTLDTEQWNHYYIRAINGEVRLWVNGKEVSGGNECNPRTGFICLESEGSPVEFRNLKLRELS